MLDATRITLANHRIYNLSGFYIVCTSNIGSQQLLRPARSPFATLERAVIAELHRLLRPELIGRFDERIVFKPLSPEIQREIGRIAICQELDQFNDRGFELTISEAAFEFLIRCRIQKTLGARLMRRTVEKFIGDAVRDALKSNAQSSGVLTVSTLNDRLIIQ
jgi:ATP-dependent Clp protease ATP-binding subunit ClpA